MSASSWWRKADSDSITPAAKAPSAIDSPPHCMASAAPSTTSRAAAVITSRARALESRRNRGLSRNRLTATSPINAATAKATCAQRETDSASSTVGERAATMASKGTMVRSSSSSTDTMRWPRLVEVSPRSSSICMTMAVDDSTKPMAPMKDTAGESPASTPAAVSTAPQVTTCNRPRPKISWRRFHSRVGCISSPMTNRNITTPNSAMSRMDCASLNTPSPKGPMASPAAR